MITYASTPPVAPALWVSACISPLIGSLVWKAPHPPVLLCSFPTTCGLSPPPECQTWGWKPVTFLAGFPLLPPHPQSAALQLRRAAVNCPLGECVFSDRDSQKMNRGQAWALRRASSSWPWRRSRPWPTSTRWKGPCPTCSGDMRTWRASWKGSRRYLSFAFCLLGGVSSWRWVVKPMCPRWGGPEAGNRGPWVACLNPSSPQSGQQALGTTRV